MSFSLNFMTGFLVSSEEQVWDMCAGPIRLELPTWLCGHSGVPVKHSAWSQRPQPSELQRALHRHSGPVLHFRQHLSSCTSCSRCRQNRSRGLKLYLKITETRAGHYLQEMTFVVQLGNNVASIVTVMNGRSQLTEVMSV